MSWCICDVQRHWNCELCQHDVAGAGSSSVKQTLRAERTFDYAIAAIPLPFWWRVVMINKADANRYATVCGGNDLLL